MTHTEFLSSILRTVRETGAVSALDQLRSERPSFDGAGYHDTKAVFYVWAIDRLVAGGLSDFGVLWHPLLEAHSPQVWWSAATLASAAAADRFVPSELACAGEPQPREPKVLLAA
jgi:hypothetical protein